MKVFSLKSKFILVSLVIVFLLSSASFFYFIPKLEDHEKEEAHEVQEQLVQQLAMSLNNSFETVTAEIESIAKLPDSTSLDPDKLDRTLTEMENVTQFFNYFFEKHMEVCVSGEGSARSSM